MDGWNKNHPVGTQVKVKGLDKIISTRTEALELFGHRAAVYLDGYKGYFDLADLTPVGETR